MRRALLLLAALLLAGCGSDDGGGSGDAAAGESVQLSAKEFSFDPASPTVGRSGETTFTVSNDGRMAHALEVEGNGVEEEMGTISPGETGTLTVDLKPGTYEFYCPIEDHRERGMEGKLVVGGAPAAGAATTGGGATTGETETDGGGYGYGG